MPPFCWQLRFFLGRLFQRSSSYVHIFPAACCQHSRIALFTPLADQGDIQLFSAEQRTTALPIQAVVLGQNVAFVLGGLGATP
jgi:hypothetical protein